MSEAQQQGMLIEPDFSEVKDSVEPGIYNGRIVDAKVDQWAGKEGKKATVYVKWTFETFNEADPKNNGRKISTNTPVNGPGAFRLKQLYKAATGEECAGQFDPTMLYGKELELTVVQQKDKNGQETEYTDVKTVKPISAVAQ